MPHSYPTHQGYRVWKFEREARERSVNFWALSLRSWSGFDVFRPLRDETDPNAIPLPNTSPLGWDHVILSGDFDWHSGAVERKITRPLHIRPDKEWGT